jgi:hypothetical protein
MESPFQLGRRSSQSSSNRRNMTLREGSPLTDLTLEEEVLAALVTADEALQEALGVYDNLERLAIERKTEELSQRFVSRVSRMSIVSALQELTIYL